MNYASQSASPKGRSFVQALIALSASEKEVGAATFAERRWGERSRAALLVRAAVAPGGPGDGQWGSELIGPDGEEFFELVRQASIVGQLTGLRRVPLNVRTIRVTGGASAFWVAAGAPKPVSRLALAGETMMPSKVAGLILVTRELLQSADPASEQRLQDDLVRACAELVDQSFIDIGNAGVPDASPASITNGIPSITSSDNPATDIAALVEAFAGDLGAAYFVTDPTTATQLALARDTAGSFLFPDASPRGGSIIGIPLIASRGSPRDSSGGQIALVDATGIAYGDSGIRMARSTQSAIAAQDDPPNGPTTMVSLWQTDTVALLTEIAVNWSRQKPGAVTVLTGATYPTGA